MTTVTRPPTAPPVNDAPGFATRPVLVIAAALLAVELSMAARYGIHRDELYFIVAGRHLAWGYVDQPPMVAVVARLMTDLFGTSAFWLRLPSAAGAAGTVVLGAAMARRLGGGRTAQLIAALAAATDAEALATFHLLSTAAFDDFFWALLSYFAVRLVTERQTNWWLPIGVTTGVALLNKLNVGFLVAGLVIGLLATPHRHLLTSRMTAAGALIATAIATPDIAWNATHHWAQITMLHALHTENSTLGASIGFIPSQLIVVGPVLAFLWIPGIKRLLRHPAGRPLAIAFLVMLAAYTLTGAKTYYLAGGYYVLFAAGGLHFEERRGRLTTRTAGMLAGAVIALPLTLPVLPESALDHTSAQGSINKDLSATVGWPQMTTQVAQVADRLPAAGRARLVIYTGDYGAAGAVDVYGPRYHLPPAISGHNNFWWWGPGSSPDDSTTIAVDLPRSYLLTLFRSVAPAGVVETPHHVWSEERGDPIYVCTGQYRTWAQAWPAARHYG